MLRICVYIGEFTMKKWYFRYMPLNGLAYLLNYRAWFKRFFCSASILLYFSREEQGFFPLPKYLPLGFGPPENITYYGSERSFKVLITP